LIGYENRLLNETDFNNDTADAGEISVGKTVTSLYELTPVGVSRQLTPRRYESTAISSPLASSTERGFLRVRCNPVGAQDSVLLEQAVLPTMAHRDLSLAAPDLRFAAAVAAFGQRLRDGH
jgi:Ca-activated chloride channel homolog